MSSVYFEQFESLWKRVEEKFISQSNESFTLDNLRNQLISQNLLPSQTDLKTIETNFLAHLHAVDKSQKEVKLSNTIFNALNRYVELGELSDPEENPNSKKDIHKILQEAIKESIKSAPDFFVEIGFLGRQKELSELENFLLSDESRIFAIFGVPMIGKTELVNHFLETNQNAKSYEIKIVEINPTPEDAEQKIMEVVFGDCKFNDFSSFTSNTLIVIRNFERALQLTGDFEKLHDIKEEYGGIKIFLSEALKVNNIKIIIESRYKIRFDVFVEHLKTKIKFLPDMQLKGVEREEFWSFYRYKNFSRKYFDELCDKFDDHTWLLARAYNKDDVIYFDNNLLKALTQFKQTTRFLWTYIEAILDQLENQEVLIICVLTHLKEPVKKENLYADLLSLAKFYNQPEANNLYFESRLQIDDFFTSLQQKLLIQTDINGFYDLNPYLQELFYTFLEERRESLMLTVLGLPYVQQHGLEQAYDKVQQALERNDHMALFDLGREWRDEGDYNKAVEAFKAGLTIDPKKENVLTEIAITYKKQKKWYEAIEVLKKANEIKPKDVKTLNELAICYRENDQLDKAIETLENTKVINLYDVKTLNELGICYRENDQLDKAIETLENAVRDYPDNVRILDELGICYRENNQIDKAIKTLEKAKEIDPRNLQTLNELAICYRENGDYEDSIKTAKKAISLRNYPSYTVLAITYQKIGNIRTAYKVLEEGMRISDWVKTPQTKKYFQELKLLVEHQKQENETLKKLKVFLSYAHKDEDIKEELDNHLSALKRSDKISTWNDRELPAGAEWDKTIKAELENADIVLLLISKDFIKSDYIWNIEIKRAIEKHENGTAVVIPIFCKSCDFEGMPFEKLQGLPRDARFIASQPDKDQVFTEVAKGIRKIVEARLS